MLLILFVFLRHLLNVLWGLALLDGLQCKVILILVFWGRLLLSWFVVVTDMQLLAIRFLQAYLRDFMWRVGNLLKYLSIKPIFPPLTLDENDWCQKFKLNFLEMRIVFCNFLLNKPSVIVFCLIFEIFLYKISLLFFVRTVLRLIVSNLLKIYWLSMLLTKIMILPII